MLLRDVFYQILNDKHEDITDLCAFIKANLTTNHFDEALDAVNAQQQSLLAGRQKHELNDNELVALSKLVNMKHEIEAAKLKRKMDADFINWLMYEDGLATLKRIATTVLV